MNDGILNSLQILKKMGFSKKMLLLNGTAETAVMSMMARRLP
jgi:hypothetical protein